MKEIPIIFSTDMVKAILAGRKTMTRRIISPRNGFCNTAKMSELDFNDAYVDNSIPNFKYLKVARREDDTRHRVWCRVFPADVYNDEREPGCLLWVRETWAPTININPPGYWYYASSDDMARQMITWRPSIHMPKEAARIWLKPIAVRPERLNDITEEDCEKEGVRIECGPLTSCPTCNKETFKKLWNMINAPRLGASCEDNPWVWVYSYEVLSTTGKENIIQHESTRV